MHVEQERRVEMTMSWKSMKKMTLGIINFLITKSLLFKALEKRMRRQQKAQNLCRVKDSEANGENSSWLKLKS